MQGRNDIALSDGWIVERHLMDDDVVLFNRCASLRCLPPLAWVFEPRWLQATLIASDVNYVPPCESMLFVCIW